MTDRTISSTVVFARPFVLQGLAGMQPAGEYVVETREELLEGISFPVWFRRSTVIRLHPRPGLTMSATVDPGELEAALIGDGVAAEARFERPLRGTNREAKKSWLDSVQSAKDGRRDSERR